MAIPGQTITINDPGMGLSEPADTTLYFAGICSSGSAAVVNTFSSITALVAAHGRGPAVETAALHLAKNGGPIRFSRLAEDTAGALGAVTQVGGGPAVSDNSSTPYDSYEMIVYITGAGALGTATMKWSLDDGRTYSDDIVIPVGGAYTIPNSGINLTFAAGTYVVDETYSCDCSEPTYTTAELATLVTAISASDDAFIGFILCGRHATAAAANTLAGALSTHLDTWESEFRYVGAMLSAVDDIVATTKTGYTTEDRRILPCYGTADRNSSVPVTGSNTLKRPILDEAAWKAGRELISTDLARVASGSLTGIAGPSVAHGVPISHDEYRNETMDASGFTTLRTWPRLSGYYLTNGRIKSGLASDFKYWQYVRVMNVALDIVITQQTAFQNASVRTNSDGTIDTRDANAMEQIVQRALEGALTEPFNAEGTKGHVSAVSYTIDRTNNVASTFTLLSELAVQPLGYNKFITTQAGFKIGV